MALDQPSAGAGLPAAAPPPPMTTDQKLDHTMNLVLDTNSGVADLSASQPPRRPRSPPWSRSSKPYRPPTTRLRAGRLSSTPHLRAHRHKAQPSKQLVHPPSAGLRASGATSSPARPPAHPMTSSATPPMSPTASCGPHPQKSHASSPMTSAVPPRASVKFTFADAGRPQRTATSSSAPGGRGPGDEVLLLRFMDPLTDKSLARHWKNFLLGVTSALPTPYTLRMLPFRDYITVIFESAPDADDAGRILLAMHKALSARDGELPFSVIRDRPLPICRRNLGLKQVWRRQRESSPGPPRQCHAPLQPLLGRQRGGRHLSAHRHCALAPRRRHHQAHRGLPCR